jgi:hypothetical protein
MYILLASGNTKPAIHGESFARISKEANNRDWFYERDIPQGARLLSLISS